MMRLIIHAVEQTIITSFLSGSSQNTDTSHLYFGVDGCYSIIRIREVQARPVVLWDVVMVALCSHCWHEQILEIGHSLILDLF